MAKDDDRVWSDLARAFALLAVRNTLLEELHAGKMPDTVVGDYSDVKVVTPTKEIPWSELSRFDDAEMKRLMKQVVDKLYTCFQAMHDPEKHEGFERLVGVGLRDAAAWDPAVSDRVLENIMEGPDREE